MKILLRGLLIICLVLFIFSCDSSSTDNDDEENIPPSKPEIVYPADGQHNIPSSPLLRWSCSDADADVLSYDLYLGIEQPELLAGNLNDTQFQLDSLSYLTEYYWQVKASDGEAVTTGDIWNFRTEEEDLSPEEPINPQPADNADDIEVNYILRWNCNEPNGDPLSFDIYLGTDTNPPLVAQDVTLFQYSANFMEYHQLYYWKVVAKSTDKETSSPLWSFTTRYSNYPPHPPEEPIPADMASNVSTTIVLRWECFDPEYDDTSFDVYMGTDAAPPLVAELHPYTQYNPGVLEGETTYYWWIRAWDNENSTDGPLWQFTTGVQNNPPDIPSFPWPEDGAVDESIFAMLRWTCSDPDGDEVFYKVYFGENPNLGENDVIAVGITEENYELTVLQYDTTYYWKIRANDGQANVTGPVWSFSTEPSR